MRDLELVFIVYLFTAKTTPFRIEFISDGYELAEDSTEGATATATDGAKIQYFQTSC